MRIPSNEEDTETRLRRRFCSPSRKSDHLTSPSRSRSRSNTPPYSSGYRRGHRCTSPVSSRPSYSSFDWPISSSPTNTPPYSPELQCGRFSLRPGSRSRSITPPYFTQLRTCYPNYILNHHEDSPAAKPSSSQQPPSQQQVVSSVQHTESGNAGRLSPDRSLSRSPMRSENGSDSISSSSEEEDSEESESESESESEEEGRRWRRSKLKVKVRGGKYGPIVSYGKTGSMVKIRGGRDGPIVTYQQPFYRP